MRRKWIPITALAVLAGFVAVALRGREARVSRKDWPVNLAHRGASARLPENTLAAFRAALDAGAGGIELDVHMTRDGRVAVIHDDTVDRTTDGSGAVREMDLAEIEALDAGYRFSPDGGATHPYRGRGFRIPTLAEVYREFPETVVNVEIKEARPGVEEAVLRVVRDAGAEDRTIVAAGRHEIIRRFRRVSRGMVPTAASYREIRVFYFMSRLYLEWLLRPGYEALQIPEYHRRMPVLTKRFVEAAHGLGLRVDVWTINDPSRMRRLLDLGADVVMTDRPEALSELLGERQAKKISTSETTPKSV